VLENNLLKELLFVFKKSSKFVALIFSCSFILNPSVIAYSRVGNIIKLSEKATVESKGRFNNYFFITDYNEERGTENISGDKIEFYFKECIDTNKLTTSEDKNSFIDQLLDEYSYTYSVTVPEEAKTLIKAALQDSNNFKKFFKMDVSWRKDRPYGKYLNSCTEENKFQGDPRKVGLPQELLNINGFDLKKFVGFSYRELNTHYMSTQEKGFLLNRYKLVDIFARQLNISDLCATSELVTLEFSDGRPNKTGLLVKKVNGVNMYSMLEDLDKTQTTTITDFENPETKNELLYAKLDRISPLLQRDLASLQVLDMLLWCVDHTPYHYLIDINDENKYYTVHCYDHKSVLYKPGVLYRHYNIFSLIVSIFSSIFDSIVPAENLKNFPYHRVSDLITKDGTINLPHLSEAFEEKFCALESELEEILREIDIKKEYKDGIIRRYKEIKQAIELTKKKNEKFLLKDHEWTIYTMLEEINYNTGNPDKWTYFQKFCKFNEQDYWA